MTGERTQLERLARPFPANLVQPPARGKYGEYVSHDVVTQALLAIVGPFEFAVTEIVRDPDGWVTGCLARLDVCIDGRYVSITEVGDCDDDAGDKHTNNGQRVKLCASDALKRCAMRIGSGLHLWSGSDYFLYKQLSERQSEQDRALGEVQPSPAPVVEGQLSPPVSSVPPPASVPEAVAQPPASGPVLAPLDVPPVATATEIHRLQERVAILNAARVRVSQERKEHNLPVIRPGISTETARDWAALLSVLEQTYLREPELPPPCDADAPLEEEADHASF